MLVAEKMNRVSVVIMKEDMEPVLEEIAKAGVLHLTRIEEIDAWARGLESEAGETLSSEYRKRQRKLRLLIEEVSPAALKEQYGRSEEISLVDLDEIDGGIAKIEKRIAPLLSARRGLSEKLTELNSLRDQIETLVPSGLPVGTLMRSTFLASAIGTIDEAQLAKLNRLLESVPSVVLPYQKKHGRIHLVCVVLRKDKAALDASLRDVAFKQTDLPKDLSEVSAEIQSRVASEIGAIEKKLADVRADIDGVREDTLPQLIVIMKKIEAAIVLLRIKDYCRLTDRTCIFSGWVPRELTDEFVSVTKEKTEGRAVVEVVGAEEIEEVREGRVEVPVLFKHPPSLRPFHMLIEGFGTPSYRMVDPTIFVAITFLVMFGMMFGDVGHGLVLLAGGSILAAKLPKLGDAGRLIVYCGISSALFGFLYGSVFGLEEVLPTLWVKPLDDITELFKFAIGFGVVVVSLGIILNIINSFRTHSFLESFFDKAGLLGGIVYWAGVGIVVKFMVSSGRLPHPVLLFGLFVLPLAVFVMKGPILRLLGKRELMFPEGVTSYVMEQIVEILEILMGYLANTVSFIRVAAFGLAHAGLFVAVFSLADVVGKAPGGVVLSWLVMILGNIGIIMLEGLVVTIQALRLEYHEFFGKFFKSTGSKYKPAGLSGALLDQTN